VSASPARPDSSTRLKVSEVVLRPAEARDCQRIWLLRNDPETQQASFDSAEIPWDVHARWFNDSLGRANRRIYMIVVKDLTEGVARLDIGRSDGVVSIHLAAEWRGRGVGPIALDHLARIAKRELKLDCLRAFVKPNNLASLSAFRKAGFVVTQTGAVVSLKRSLRR
jgi:RimJ/RimL family protein N-acetyltransferase